MYLSAVSEVYVSPILSCALFCLLEDMNPKVPELTIHVDAGVLSRPSCRLGNLAAP